MMTFLTIFSVLVGLNVALVVASLISVSKKAKTSSQNSTKQTAQGIYPLDLLTTSYKKAV